MELCDGEEDTRAAVVKEPTSCEEMRFHFEGRLELDS